MQTKQIALKASIVLTLFFSGLGYAQSSMNALPLPPKDVIETLLFKFKAQREEGMGLAPSERTEALISDEQALAAQLALADLESICGSNNLTYVKDFDSKLGFDKALVSKLESSVGMLQWNKNLDLLYTPPKRDPGNVAGARWCSGTLISPNLFLTAGHCFDREHKKGWQLPTIKDDANNIFEVVSSNELAQNMSIHFNFNRPIWVTNNNIITYQVDRLISYLPDGIDVALLQVSPKEQSKVVNPLANLSFALPTREAEIAVIQHPAGAAKSIDVGNVLESWPFVTYANLDTKGGSSGSPVFDSNGNVFAVHIAGGCNQTSGKNFAVPLKRVEEIFR